MYCFQKHCRSCEGVEFIPKIAKLPLQGLNKEEIKTYLQIQNSKLQSLKSTRMEYLRKIDNDKNKTVKEIKQIK